MERDLRVCQEEPRVQSTKGKARLFDTCFFFKLILTFVGITQWFLSKTFQPLFVKVLAWESFACEICYGALIECFIAVLRSNN